MAAAATVKAWKPRFLRKFEPEKMPEENELKQEVRAPEHPHIVSISSANNAGIFNSLRRQKESGTGEVAVGDKRYYAFQSTRQCLYGSEARPAQIYNLIFYISKIYDQLLQEKVIVPQYKLLVDEANQTPVAALSVSEEGYKRFAEDGEMYDSIPKDFFSPDFARLVAASWILRETDLHPGNFGLANGKWVRLDFDYSALELQKKLYPKAFSKLTADNLYEPEQAFPVATLKLLITGMEDETTVFGGNWIQRFCPQWVLLYRLSQKLDVLPMAGSDLEEKATMRVVNEKEIEDVIKDVGYQISEEEDRQQHIKSIIETFSEHRGGFIAMRQAVSDVFARARNLIKGGKLEAILPRNLPGDLDGSIRRAVIEDFTQRVQTMREAPVVQPNAVNSAAAAAQAASPLRKDSSVVELGSPSRESETVTPMSAATPGNSSDGRPPSSVRRSDLARLLPPIIGSPLLLYREAVMNKQPVVAPVPVVGGSGAVDSFSP